MNVRHQLAAYSPVRPMAVADAMLAIVGMKGASPIALRNRLLARYGADDCLLVGSGTQALQHAIDSTARGSHRGGFIALPAFNCYDMASAALGAGVRVALYDVDPATLAPDRASFERVLAAGATVGVLAYLYGVPFDWEPLAAIAEQYGVPLIEDAAQGHGASSHDVALGALGDTSIISFGRGKGWTGGNGGAVLVRHGRGGLEGHEHGAASSARVALGLAAQWLLGRPALYGLPRSLPALALGETVYHAPSAVSLMSHASASAALRNESASDREARVRAENGRRFTAGLLGSAAQLIALPAGSDPGYIRFPVLLRNGMESLPPRAVELGVSPSYPTTLTELPELRGALIEVDTVFPGADRLAKELLTLPTHSLVRERERAEIIGLIRAVR